MLAGRELLRLQAEASKRDGAWRSVHAESKETLGPLYLYLIRTKCILFSAENKGSCRWGDVLLYSAGIMGCSGWSDCNNRTTETPWCQTLLLECVCVCVYVSRWEGSKCRSLAYWVAKWNFQRTTQVNGSLLKWKYNSVPCRRYFISIRLPREANAGVFGGLAEVLTVMLPTPPCANVPLLISRLQMYYLVPVKVNSN